MVPGVATSHYQLQFTARSNGSVGQNILWLRVLSMVWISGTIDLTHWTTWLRGSLRLLPLGSLYSSLPCLTCWILLSVFISYHKQTCLPMWLFSVFLLLGNLEPLFQSCKLVGRGPKLTCNYVFCLRHLGLIYILRTRVCMCVIESIANILTIGISRIKIWISYVPWKMERFGNQGLECYITFSL